MMSSISSFRARAGLVLCILVAASWLIALDADPGRMLWRDFITDEGWWTAEARDHALFGDWVLDEYNQGLAVPLATWVWRWAFAIGGVTLAAARMPSLLASALILVLLGLMLRRARGRDPLSGEGWEEGPAPVLLLLATAIPFAQYARLAAPEPLSLLLVTASWWTLAGASGGNALRVMGGDGGEAVLTRALPAGPILAGLLLGAALSAKLSAVVAVPALAWLAHRHDDTPDDAPRLMRWQPALYLLFGTLLAWSLLRLPFLSRYPAELGALEAIYRGENLPGSPVDLLSNLAFFPWPSPFLYQVAPLLALAGVGAWQIGLAWRGRSLASQALAFLLLTALAQGALANPADRRFLLFLPALTILAARGWRALAAGETIRGQDEDASAVRPLRLWLSRSGTGAAPAFLAALAAAFVLPGRMAIWIERLLRAAGRPPGEFPLRAAAAILFVATLLVVWFWLRRRPARTGAVLRVGLIAGWIFVCLEPFDFLIWAGLAQAWGSYDAGRVWLECGAWWSLPWGLLTLALVWLPLARGGLLPRFALLERGRRWLPAMVPLLAFLVLAPDWMLPRYTLRDAAARLSAPLENGGDCKVVVGAEAPSLLLGSRVQAIPTRGDFNTFWHESPPPGTRILRLIEDSGRVLPGEGPAGADTLSLCPQRQAADTPRFVFVHWDVP